MKARHPEISLQDPMLTCSQWIFGPIYYSIYMTMKVLDSNPAYIKVKATPNTLEVGDIVVYKFMLGDPSHVGMALGPDLVCSKFTGDPTVYIHSVWDLDNEWSGERVAVYRRKK